MKKLYLVLAPTLLVALALAAFGDTPSGRSIASCQTAPVASVEADAERLRNIEKVKIQADEIYFPGRRTVRLVGYAELVRGGHRVYANELLYNRAETRAVARGSVLFETAEGDLIFSSSLTYYVDTGDVESGSASFLIVNRTDDPLELTDNPVDSYGTASHITFVDDHVMYLENAEITSCLKGKAHTVFSASELRIDLNEGIRTAKQVKIRVAPKGPTARNETAK